MNEAKIVVLGGGTGASTLLRGLKLYTKRLSAIVNMVDDGGSTGVLRDELGVLPPGDVRQCLVALSDSKRLNQLFDYRFEEGSFKGHSFGNLFLAAVEKMNGDFNEAIATAADVLRIRGKVIPATLDNVRLVMKWPDGEVMRQESTIDAARFAQSPRLATLSSEPNSNANPLALSALTDADLIVIAPGDLYTSLGPLLAIDGIRQSLRTSKIPIVYVSNLVTKAGHTDGLGVKEHAEEIERLAGGAFLSGVIYNTSVPDQRTLERYAQEDSELVHTHNLDGSSRTYSGADLLGEVEQASSADVIPVTRGFVRHDSHKVAAEIIRYLDGVK